MAIYISCYYCTLLRLPSNSINSHIRFLYPICTYTFALTADENICAHVTELKTSNYSSHKEFYID